jgi:hypothetical protein
VGTFGALYGFAHYGVDLYATSDISVTVTGIIRAITINDGAANYKCEVVTVEPESGAESGSASASSS